MGLWHEGKPCQLEGPVCLQCLGIRREPHRRLEDWERMTCLSFLFCTCCPANGNSPSVLHSRHWVEFLTLSSETVKLKSASVVWFGSTINKSCFTGTRSIDSTRQRNDPWDLALEPQARFCRVVLVFQAPSSPGGTTDHDPLPLLFWFKHHLHKPWPLLWKSKRSQVGLCTKVVSCEPMESKL